MGKEVTYLDMAENDYEFFLCSYQNGQVGNPMCYAAQNMCERYLKHIIDISCKEMDTTHVLKTHNLRNIKQFICSNVKGFTCDWRTVLQADGYYFSTRYPGEEAHFVDKEEVDECWEAVEETRRAVLDYCNTVKIDTKSLSSNSEVIKVLEDF